MASDPLERVKRIIRELQKKTIDNGCTEEEALAAAKLMGDLMQKHDLEMDEVGLKEETAQCKKNVVRAVDDFASSIVVGIGNFCTLKVWRSAPGEFTFFGTPHDLEIGKYLYEIISEAMDYGWSEYSELVGYSMKKRASYRMGFAHRVCERLRELKEERNRAVTGTALVVLKDQLVTEEFAKLNMRLDKARPQMAGDSSAYYSGVSAGSKVNLNNPLTGGNRTTQIR